MPARRWLALVLAGALLAGPAVAGQSLRLGQVQHDADVVGDEGVEDEVDANVEWLGARLSVPAWVQRMLGSGIRPFAGFSGRLEGTATDMA